MPRPTSSLPPLLAVALRFGLVSVGALLALGGSFTVFAGALALATMNQKPEELVTNAVLGTLLVVFGGAATFGGAKLARWSWSGSWYGLPGSEAGRVPSGPAAEERAILALAASSDRRLTVAEVVLKTGMSGEASQAALHRLTVQGLTRLYVTGDGEMVYAFGGFLTSAQKAAAVDPTSQPAAVDATPAGGIAEAALRERLEASPPPDRVERKRILE